MTSQIKSATSPGQMYLKSKDRPLPEDVEEDLKGTNFCLTIQDLANLTVSPSDEEYDSLGDVPLDSRMSRLCYSRSGNLTGHSSNGSWEIDDEFDQAARQNVQKVLDNLFGTLYNESTDGDHLEVKAECSMWSDTFPHLRIVGYQVFPEVSDGTEEVVMDTPPATAVPKMRTVGETTSLPDYNGLTISGVHLQPVALYCDHTDLNDDCSTIEEEIIAADGIVEEYIVFDSMVEDEGAYSSHQQQSQRRRHLLPPVTPNACVRDTVSSQVFDQLWTEVGVALQPLLESLSILHKRERCLSYMCNGDLEEDAISPLISDTATPHMFPGLRDLPTLMRATGQFGSQPLRLKPLPQSSKEYQASSTKPLELNEVMKIRPLPLQKRSLASNSVMSPSDQELWDHHPDTSTLPLQMRAQNIVQLRLPDQLGNARLVSGKNKRNAQLKPLEKPKTPALPMEELVRDFSGLRGQRLSTHTELGSSAQGMLQSPLPWVRNTQLPPLEDPHDRLSPSMRNSALKNKAVTFESSSRISSAAASNRSNYEIYKVNPSSVNDPRPSTVNTGYRSETPRAIGRRGSHQSVSNTLLTLPSRTKLFSGIIGHAPIRHSDTRERFEDEDEMVIPEESDSDEPVGWKGPLYLSPFWSKPRTNVAGIMKYRGHIR